MDWIAPRHDSDRLAPGPTLGDDDSPWWNRVLIEMIRMWRAEDLSVVLGEKHSEHLIKLATDYGCCVLRGPEPSASVSQSSLHPPELDELVLIQCLTLAWCTGILYIADDAFDSNRHELSHEFIDEFLAVTKSAWDSNSGLVVEASFARTIEEIRIQAGKDASQRYERLAVRWTGAVRRLRSLIDRACHLSNDVHGARMTQWFKEIFIEHLESRHRELDASIQGAKGRQSHASLREFDTMRAKSGGMETVIVAVLWFRAQQSLMCHGARVDGFPVLSELQDINKQTCDLNDLFSLANDIRDREHNIVRLMRHQIHGSEDGWERAETYFEPFSMAIARTYGHWVRAAEVAQSWPSVLEFAAHELMHGMFMWQVRQPRYRIGLELVRVMTNRELPNSIKRWQFVEILQPSLSKIAGGERAFDVAQVWDGIMLPELDAVVQSQD